MQMQKTKEKKLSYHNKCTCASYNSVGDFKMQPYRSSNIGCWWSDRKPKHAYILTGLHQHTKHAGTQLKKASLSHFWFTWKSGMEQSHPNFQCVPRRCLWTPYSTIKKKKKLSNTLTGWLWKEEPLQLPLIVALTALFFLLFRLSVGWHVQTCPMKAPLLKCDM